MFIFQTFRILDGKDGKVDGILGLAKKEAPAADSRPGMSRLVSAKAKEELQG